MREKIEEINKEKGMLNLRFTVSVLCAVLLLIAYIFSAPFYTQLLIYLFLLFNSRHVLKEGFFALSAFSPDKKSLAAFSAFAALLYGVSTFDVKNCFFYSALTLSLFEVGEYICTELFKTKESGEISDKISAAMLMISLALSAVSVIIGLFSGRYFISVITRGFLIFVLACPCTVGVFDIVFSSAAAKAAKNHGAEIANPAAVEKLGKVKELIIEQRGIITENNYSLYDIYSADNDKIELLCAVAAIEEHFSHPFAYAIIHAAKKTCEKCKKAENCIEISGKGVCATVDGDRYLVGTKRLLRDKRVVLPDAIENADFGMYTVLYVAKNREFAGLMLLYSKMYYGAAAALDAIGELGIRRIILADGERQDLKKHSDILLFEREKVLQEFKKGAKIKAMTVTEKRIANADIVGVVTGEGDVLFSQPFAYNLLCTLIFGRKAYSRIKAASVAAFALSFVFAAFVALDIAFSPLVLALAVSFPLLFCLGISNTVLPDFTFSEEEDMFGKVNYTMKINGMSCTHCSARVKTALETLRGVSADVSLEEKTARIKCPASTSAETLAKAVTDVGFTVVSTERV